MEHRADSPQLLRWKAARRISLAAILLVGSMATVSVSVQNVARPHAVVYSGIGIAMTEQVPGIVVVSDVNPDGPAFGQIPPGAILLAADCTRRGHSKHFQAALIGDAGTQVDVTFRPREGAPAETIRLTREVVRAWLP